METKDTYNIVAKGWNNFRQKPMFPEWFDMLVKRWKGGVLLDIGCGNGRNMAPFKGFQLTGIDYSKEMIENAKKFADRKSIKAKFHIADVRKLPFKDSSIDNALGIAVYHHLNPEELKDALKELHRVLRPDGEAFITVWNRHQWKFLFKPSDQNIPWKRRKDDKTYYRYYHLYTRNELRKIIQSAGFSVIMEGSESSFRKKFFSRNICFLVGKRWNN